MTLLAWGACSVGATSVFAEEPRVAAVRLDGSQVTGRLVEFDGQRFRVANEQGTGQRFDLPMDEVLSIEFEGRVDAAAIAQPVLEFANGDRFHAEILETSDDQVVARWHDANLTVPLETLRGIVFRPLDVNDGSTELLMRDRGADDVVLLSNGDRLTGQFLSLGTSDLKIDVEGREVLAPRERVAAILFSPELTLAASIAGTRHIVHDRTGWLTVESLTRESSGSWTATTAFGPRVSWPVGTVRRLQNFSDRVVPLSSLSPRIEFTPYLDRTWPVRPGRTVTGEPLSIDDQLYATGVGVHSRCRLQYDLRQEFSSFHVVAGLASSSAKLGNVEFAIELDGREVVRTGPVERSSEPLRVDNLDVQNVETMILTVDFSRNGDVLDRANWCDAVLVRKAAASE